MELYPTFVLKGESGKIVHCVHFSFYLTIKIPSGLCKIAPYCVATVGKGGSNLRLDDDDQHCGHGSTLITAEEKSPFFFFIVVFQGNGRAAAAYAHTLRNY